MNEKNLSDNPNLKQIDEKKLILSRTGTAEKARRDPSFFSCCKFKGRPDGNFI